MPLTIDGEQFYTQAEALEVLGLAYESLLKLATDQRARQYRPAREAIITRRYLHPGSAAYYLKADVDRVAATPRRPGNKPGWRNNR